MIIKCIALGPYEANCYLVKDSQSDTVILIDPGYYCRELESFLAENGVNKINYILITHGHADHFCGAPYVREKFGGQIVIGERDAFAFEKYRFGAFVPEYENQFRPFEADILAGDDFSLPFGEHEITVLPVKGHSPGGLCYIIDGKLMFCGDAIFKNGIGRYDLMENGLFYTIKTVRLFANLNVDYILYPGHGEGTTLFAEQQNNPTLRNARK